MPATSAGWGPTMRSTRRSSSDSSPRAEPVSIRFTPAGPGGWRAIACLEPAYWGTCVDSRPRSFGTLCPMEMKAGRQRPRPPEASTVVAYDPTWPHLFRSMKERLQELLVGSEAVIEHVGSTAVPGLPAKPIVDIDVVVPSSPDIPDAVRRLESGGYICRGDLGIPGREAFDVPPDLPYHHLYAVAAGTKPHLDHVLLRDHLRSHPAATERYGRRKLEVAHLITAGDRQAYMAAKASIVEELLAVARREFAS